MERTEVIYFHIILTCLFSTLVVASANVTPDPCVKSLTKRVKRRWNNEIITHTIRGLHDHGVPINFAAIRNNFAAQNLPFLHSLLGFESNGNSLFRAAYRRFGSWDNAVAAAGLKPDDARLDIRWSRDRIIEVLRDLEAQKFPLNEAAVRHDDMRTVQKTIERLFQRPIEGKGFVAVARVHFGSWYAAVDAAGFDARAVRKQNQWSKELVVAGIQALALAGRPLFAHHMAQDESEEGAQIVSSGTGFATTPGMLLDRACAWFASWDDALNAAGLDPGEVRKRGESVRWSVAKVILSIRALQARGLRINWQAVCDADRDKFADTLEEVLGTRVQPHALLGAGAARFGSWDRALAAAGFDPQDVRAVAIAVPWDQDLVKTAIRLLRASGCSLNYNSIVAMDPEQCAEILEPILGARPRPFTLVSAAPKCLAPGAPRSTRSGSTLPSIETKGARIGHGNSCEILFRRLPARIYR